MTKDASFRRPETLPGTQRQPPSPPECPWGLNGYGFDPYIAATPGNAVMALASFWADNVQATLAAEDRFPDACLRLRYEDLVADPEATAAAVFEFLGVPAAPGITEACFSADRERFGPADYKIWHTSQITDDSVGRGWSVPTAMIAPQLLGVMNELSGRLGYLAVDGDWGTTEPPADLRVPITPPKAEPGPDSAAADQGDEVGGPAEAAAAGAEPQAGDGAEPELAAAGSAAKRRAAPQVIEGPLRSERLGATLRSGLLTGSGAEHVRLQPHASETFVAVAITKGAARPAEYWLVDLGEATFSPVGNEAQEDSDWDVIGTLEAWEKIIDRQVNLSVAMRSLSCGTAITARRPRRPPMLASGSSTICSACRAGTDDPVKRRVSAVPGHSPPPTAGGLPAGDRTQPAGSGPATVGAGAPNGPICSSHRAGSNDAAAAVGVIG